MTQREKDLDTLANYVLETEYENFLECLSENGATVLSDEEVNSVLCGSIEETVSNQLVDKECASVEQDHIYAIAWRLMQKE